MASPLNRSWTNWSMAAVPPKVGALFQRDLLDQREVLGTLLELHDGRRVREIAELVSRVALRDAGPGLGLGELVLDLLAVRADAAHDLGEHHRAVVVARAVGIGLQLEAVEEPLG